MGIESLNITTEYVVQNGDNLTKIINNNGAQACASSFEEIKENSDGEIKDINLLSTGQKIVFGQDVIESQL